MSKLKYFDGTNWKIVNGQITGDTLPIGSIIPYTSENAPTGWLVCIGQTLSKTTYPELFDIIGYTFGGEEGGDTFNLPNLKGRVLVGRDTSQTEFEDIGQTGGSKYIQDHYHEYKFGSSAGGDGSGLAYSSTTGTQPNKAAIQGVKGVTTGNSGNLQPYMVTNYIIKVKQTAGLVGAVIDSYSTSHTDTYSCDYINSCNLYSTNETFTGKYWIDGKPIYRKIVNVGVLPNATFKEVAHGISDLEDAIDIRLIAKTSTGVQFTGNMYGTSGVYNDRIIVTRITTTNIQIASNVDSSNHSGYVILEYTKTTD